MTTDTAVESVAVLSAEDVGWMMRSIRDATSRIAEAHMTHEAFRARLAVEMRLIDEGEQHDTKEDRDKIAYLTHQLEAHLLNRRAADPECKSISTPWGRIESREQQPEFKRDETVLLEWADNYRALDIENFVRTKTRFEVDWEGIKAHCHVRGDLLLTPEGEVVPGVTVVERPLKVTVKTID